MKGLIGCGQAVCVAGKMTPVIITFLLCDGGIGFSVSGTSNKVYVDVASLFGVNRLALP